MDPCHGYSSIFVVQMFVSGLVAGIWIKGIFDDWRKGGDQS